MDINKIRHFVEHTWTDSIIPTLSAYITIPNQSPAYDTNWHHNGYMAQAVKLVVNWIRAQEVPGLTLDVVRLDGRTPLLYIKVPGESIETELLYVQLDKQQTMQGWYEGLGPCKPVKQHGKLS